MNLNNRIDDMKEKLISSTQEILKIKSVEDTGVDGAPFGEGVAKALAKALEISSNLGFKTVNLDGYAGYAEYGEGEEYIGVLGHLDVVPEGDGWAFPPYGAEIHDGRIYARGALDDKGPTMAALFGLKALKDEGLKLSKKVRIIFGTNEETGSREIHHYLSTEKPPIAGFTPDAEYPIINGEKGIAIFNMVRDINNKTSKNLSIKYIKGGHRPNMVPEYCEAGIAANDAKSLLAAVKRYADENKVDIKAELKDEMVVVSSYGIAAHGSLPHLGVNAIMRLFAFLGTLDFGKCDIADFIGFMNKHIGMETTGDSFGVGLYDKVSGKLSFNVGVIEMDENIVKITLNLRYPVTFKLEDMMNPFNKTLEGTGIRVEDFGHQKPLYYPEDHPLIKTLQKVYTEQTGKEAKLLSIGGGTYAKEMPNIVAFGPIFPGKPDLDHQANEYIEVEDLILNAKIYSHAIYELAK